MTHDQAVRVLLANAKAPLRVWAESKDGKTARRTALSVTSAELLALRKGLQEAHDFAVLVGGPNAWIGFRGVDVAPGSVSPRMAGVLGPQVGGVVRKVDVSFAVHDRVCLVCRFSDGPRTMRVPKYFGLYPPEHTTTWVCKPEIRPQGVIRLDAAQCHVLRRDVFVEKRRRYRVELRQRGQLAGYGWDSSLQDLLRVDVRFLVSTPTDRDQVHRMATETFVTGGSDDSYMYARGIADSKMFASLASARAYLARVPGQVSPPLGEAPAVAVPRPGEQDLEAPAHADGGDPTAALLTEVKPLPLAYSEKPFVWDYAVEECSVRLHDGLVDLAGPLDGDSGIRVGLQPPSRAALPLEITFLMRLENPQDPLAGLARHPGAGRASRAGLTPSRRSLLARRERRKKRQRSVHLTLRAGSYDKKRPGHGLPPGAGSMRRRVKKRASGSRAPNARAARSPDYFFFPWVTASVAVELPEGWQRITMRLSPTDQRMWMNGKSVADAARRPTCSRRALVGGIFVDPGAPGALPPQAHWKLQVSSSAQRIFITDIRVRPAPGPHKEK